MLGLHESSVVGMATGFALGRREPALAILHTTAGLGNAVSAIATARVNRVPLVVARRPAGPAPPRLGAVPRGAAAGARGRLPGLGRPAAAGAETSPASIARAYHEAVTGRGPALVIVPMDDWAAEATPARGAGRAAARRARRGRPTPPSSRSSPSFSTRAERPALVVGAGVDDADTWAALVALAERLVVPRLAGVVQRPRRVPAGPPAVRRPPAGRPDAPARRRSRRTTSCSPSARRCSGSTPSSPGPFVEPGTTVVVVSQDPAEVHRSTADLAVLAPPAAVCAGARAARAAREARAAGRRSRAPTPPEPPARGEPLRAGHVFAALAERLPRTTRSSSRSRRPTVRSCSRACRRAQPLGIAQPRDGRPRLRASGRDRAPDGAARPSGGRDRRRRLVALLDPGALERGALPRRRAVRDPLERRLRDHGPARRAARAAPRPWPGFGVDVAGLARAFGCPARTRARARRAARRHSTRSFRASRAATSRCCSRSSSSPTRASRREGCAACASTTEPLELVERPRARALAAERRRSSAIGGAGVCATDLHAIEGLMEPAGVTLPRVLGHENAGWVEAVGDRASRPSRRATRCSSTRRTAAASASPAGAATTCTACATSSPACRSTAASPTTCSSSERSLVPLPGGRRAGRGRAARRRRAHRLPRRPAARAPRRPRHDRRRDRRRRRRAHRAPARCASSASSSVIAIDTDERRRRLATRARRRRGDRRAGRGRRRARPDRRPRRRPRLRLRRHRRDPRGLGRDARPRRDLLRDRLRRHDLDPVGRRSS